MSINGWVNHLLREQRLHRVEPVFASDAAGRLLLVSPQIAALIDGPWANDTWKARCVGIRAHLENFAAGGEISVCTDPFKATEEDLAILHDPKDGVWDMRLRAPRPGLRLIGQFAAQDVFVALVPATRSQPSPFISRGPLGDRNSVEWKRVIRECKMQFRSLFNPHPAIGGGNINDVLSGNFYPE